MYKGEVNVEYCQLSALLKTAESLKVKGLADMTNINAAVASREDHQQQQQQQQLSSDSVREREREKDTKERDKDIAMMTTTTTTTTTTSLSTNNTTNMKESNEQQQQPQQQQHTIIGAAIANSEKIEAVDMSDCPPSPTGPGSPCQQGPLALDRPRRDSEDAVSLEENRGSLSPISVHSGPSDMSLSNNTGGTTPGVLPLNLPQSRLPSPHSTEPLAGPSGLPPVQQVPLVSFHLLNVITLLSCLDK